MTYRFAESAAPDAICRAPDGRARGAARVVLIGQSAEVAGTMERPAAAAAARLESGSGRVQGGGTFEDATLHAALAGVLPPACAASLRTRFEWYGCFGAFFHNDAHYDGVLFGVLAVLGPPRDVYFPRIGVRTSAAPGAWAVFDPFEPHGVVAPGRCLWQREEYSGSPPSLFVGFEIELTPAVADDFGIAMALPADRRMVELSSRSAIHAETGAFA